MVGFTRDNVTYSTNILGSTFLVVLVLLTSLFILKTKSYSEYSGVSFSIPVNNTTALPRAIYVATDSEDNKYVVSNSTHQVVKLNPLGVELLRFGNLGSGDGQFDNPHGVAVDSLNNVIVADRNNNRIQVFNSSGIFQRKFGMAGGDPGKFFGPTGVVVNSMDNIIVVDTGNQRIQVFNTAGNLLFSMGLDFNAGSAENEFRVPFGVTVDSLDRIIVADKSNDRVQVFNFLGTFQFMFGWGVNTGAMALETCTSGCQSGISGLGAGNIGGGDGQLTFPIGITVDSSDNIIVADQSNDRIQVFNSSGVFQNKYGGIGNADGLLDDPGGVTVDSSGNIIVSDTEHHRIQIFNSAGTFQSKFGSLGDGNGQFNFPRRIAVDSLNNIIVADSKNHRIQVFNSAGVFKFMFGWGVNNGSNSFQTCSTSCQAEISGSGDGQFDKPYGVAVDSSDNIIVADKSDHRIQVFNSAGVFKFMFGWGVGDGSNAFQVCKLSCQAGISGNGEGQFNDPITVAVDSADNIIVADSKNHRIQVFNSAGVFLFMFGWDVTVGGGIGLEICTFTDTCKFGTQGSGNGQFNNPEGVAVDSSDNIVVADTGNNRIQVFNSTGTFQSKFGSLGGGDGQLNSPKGVAVGGSGNIVVADSDNNRVQVFTCNELINNSLAFDPNPGSFTTNNPPISGFCTGYAEEFLFDATMQNNDSVDIVDLIAQVLTLTNENVLGNADGAPGTVGSILTVPSFTDDVLSPGESVDVPFVICKNNTSGFDFFVDVYGNPVVSVMSLLSSLINDINDLFSNTNTVSAFTTTNEAGGNNKFKGNGPKKLIIDGEPNIEPEALSSEVQTLIEPVNEQAAILIEPLQEALDNIEDGDEKNNMAVCAKLKSFIREVENYEKDGLLTVEEADDLIINAEEIQNLHGCK